MKIYWYALAILLVIASVIFGMRWHTMSKEWTPREFIALVEKHYVSEEGPIRSYGTPENDEYLSESIGLYMNWLSDHKEEERLDQMMSVLKEKFFESNQGNLFVSWRISSNDKAFANASIDDARIAEVMASTDENATRLKETYNETQIVQGLVHDFYDWSVKKSSGRVVMSYGIPEFIEDEEKMVELYEEIAGSHDPFFPEAYLTESKTWKSNEKIHLVDQLLIALQLEKLELDNEKFYRFIRNDWQEDGKLSGNFDRITLEGGALESASVYALAAELANNKGDIDVANSWRERGLKLVTPEDGDYSKIHFFDLIWYAP